MLRVEKKRGIEVTSQDEMGEDSKILTLVKEINEDQNSCQDLGKDNSYAISMLPFNLTF